MYNPDGIIIVLAYPDTIVRPAYWERLSTFWPKIGVGGSHAVQAGHAALLLIQKKKSEINYYDFGRYITTYGNGRVRSKETDPEIKISIPAKFKNNELSNKEEILLYMERHSEKTHGDGRLVASIHEEIDFYKAQKFILELIDKKELPYGVFIKNGTNCARFVTNVIIASTQNKRIYKQLKKSNLLSPSPIGNVIKANTNNTIYKIYNQEITNYLNRSILKEYKLTFFTKLEGEPNLKGTEIPDLDVFELINGTWLGGIGSGAWFHLEEKVTAKTYKISRYTSKGIKDFEGLFTLKETDFNPLEAYKFVHPTNCVQAHIQQNNKLFCLLIINQSLR
tara:strand:- start:273 stop:1280 length:1008 start_codon:yes stop_codon:yes gene_type:complete